VAVRVPYWPALNVPVLTVNVPVSAPAATVAEAGTAKADNPLLFMVTTAPPLGATFDSVTVQVEILFDPKVVGVHPNRDGSTSVVNLIFTVCEVPL